MHPKTAITLQAMTLGLLVPMIGGGRDLIARQAMRGTS